MASETAAAASKIIPFGFQATNTINLERASPLLDVLHLHQGEGLQGGGGFFFRDREGVSLYSKGRLQYSINRDANPLVPASRVAAITGITDWRFLAKWGLMVAITENRELRLLDGKMHLLDSMYTNSSNLSLALDAARNELIVGGIGVMEVYSLRRTPSTHGKFRYAITGPTFAFPGLSPDQWITHIAIHPGRTVFAAYDDSILVFSWPGRERLHHMREVHALNITTLLVQPDLGYLVTAAKDGCVKVWNSEQALIHELHECRAVVTGMVLLTEHSKVKRRTVSTTYVVVSANDGSVLMYDIEQGTLYHR